MEAPKKKARSISPRAFVCSIILIYTIPSFKRIMNLIEFHLQSSYKRCFPPPKDDNMAKNDQFRNASIHFDGQN